MKSDLIVKLKVEEMSAAWLCGLPCKEEAPKPDQREGLVSTAAIKVM